LSHLFFSHQPLNNVLDEQESLHVVKVLRLHEGDSIKVANGNGLIVDATITKAHPKQCAYQIKEIHEQKRVIERSVDLIIAPTKATERMEWLVEKACEMGVSSITFIITQRTERKQINIEKLQKVALAALKQSGQFFIPQLHISNDFETLFNTCKNEVKLIAHLGHELPYYLTEHKTNQSVSIAIGPEGDFTEQEINCANTYGFKSISLGNAIFRTETAAILACYGLLNQNQVYEV
jgi:16S rRNA (uracil1498-N3)-methyltransferase